MVVARQMVLFNEKIFPGGGIKRETLRGRRKTDRPEEYLKEVERTDEVIYRPAGGSVWPEGRPKAGSRRKKPAKQPIPQKNAREKKEKEQKKVRTRHE